MSGFPFQVTDEAAYLDRQERMRRATHGDVLDPEVMSAILREVEPLPWVIGRWYRVRLLAGKPHNRHVHGLGEAGVEHAVDIPQLAAVDWAEAELRPLGRMPAHAGQRHVSAMFFGLRDGRTALFHEIDVFSASEVPA